MIFMFKENSGYDLPNDRLNEWESITQMKKTKDIVSQENKFLRLCGDKYRDKIKKRIPMSVGGFSKIYVYFQYDGIK